MVNQIIQEISNVGLTILCVIVGIVIINWLDRNIFNKNRRFKDDKWD